jgi:hypothetical protein
LLSAQEKMPTITFPVVMRQRKTLSEEEVMYGSERCEKVAPACGVGSCRFSYYPFPQPSAARL